NNIIGFPWETKKHIKNTVKMNIQVPKNIEYFATVATPIPYPASDLYELYYEQYGFKDWWLDTKNHEELPSAIESRPFYMNFMHCLISHDMKVNFWHYSEDMKKTIFKAKLDIQLLYLKNKVPRFLLWIIVILSRLSAFLDYRTPTIERIAFYPIPKRFITWLSKKFNFTTF
ncbi:MAG: hypothetical protein ACE5H1_03660, partial [Thermodesulfobacteriota bacterium]